MTKYRLTKADLESQIKEVRYQRFGETGMLCVIILQNDYVITGESACIDPEIFNEDMGKQVAFDNAFDKLWGILGYGVKQQWYEETQWSWVARVKKELAELDEKRAKLDTLIQAGKPNFIKDRQWDLMVKQNEVMATYAMILQERIVTG